MLKPFLFVFALIPLLCACTSVTHRGQDDFEREFDAGDFKAAAMVYIDSLKTEQIAANESLPEGKKPKELSLEFFPALNTATASFIANEPQKADEYFDLSLKLIKQEKTDNYDPRYYEKIMLNTYSGLNAWRAKNMKDARVEFNRAHQSQALAIEENKKKISELEDETISKNLESSLQEAKKQIKEKPLAFKNLKAYKNFANPYTSYLSGLFLILNHDSISDIENGINYLKRVKGMMPDNHFIKEDIKMAEEIATGKPFPPTVWVLYEGGLAPAIDKLTIEVPLYFGRGFKIASMSLPQFAPKEAGLPSIMVKSNNKYISTELIANMDAIVETELNERMPWEIAKALLWMSVNLLAQEGVQQAFGNNHSTFGFITSVIISQITNPVETRTWASLPKNIEIARLPIPQNGAICLYSDKENPLSETITFNKATKYAIVYVRVPTITAKPAVLVSEFKL